MTLTERDRENREEGKQEERINIATKLLDVLDDETIALKTELSIEVVRSLRKNSSNIRKCDYVFNNHIFIK